MRCASCGGAIDAEHRFCPACGARVAPACPRCGAALPADARFCPQCGLARADEPVPGHRDEGAGRVPAGEATAADSTPTERRIVSVLFVDLVGFTAASERRDAEETRQALDRYFAVTRSSIERHGGRVEKFIGDAVMALWGAPVAHEDDAERAVRAALDGVAAVDALEDARGATLRARAGVTTGEAAVTVGSAEQGMVAGDVVNTAARLQAAAAPGTVLVDESTRRATAASIVFEPVPDPALPGKALPARASRAVRVVAGVGGAGREDRLEPPFVGRTVDLALLKDLFHATVTDGRLRTVSITGQAGIGKSRLAWELEKYVAGLADEVTWLQGRSPSYGEGVTFWALAEMVRRQAGTTEQDEVATARDRVAAVVDGLARDGREAESIRAALHALLGVDDTTGGGILEKGELFAALRLVFERLAERSPTVLVFEDLHWADQGLLEFVEHLLEWSRSFPLFVVALARPELHDRRPGWGARQRNFTNLHLEPLDEAAMTLLLRGLAPGLPDPAIGALVTRAEGVPLYAVETVRMLVADGTLEAAGGTFRLARPIERLAIPQTLHALIAARIDALLPDDRALLQHAAVLGQSFAPAALGAVTGRAPAQLESALDRLARTELLRRESDPGSPERGQYRFLQAVVREVAYTTLSRRERRERHLVAARYFEALGDEDLAGVLATHYDAAREAASPGAEADALAGQARVALRAAAERASRLHSHGQAVAYLERAMALTSDPGERAGLAERAADVADLSGLDDAAQRLYRAAADDHRHAGETSRELRSLARLAAALSNVGQPREAIELLEDAGARLRPAVEAEGAAAAAFLGQLGRAKFLARETAAAMPIVDRAIGIAERLDERAILVDAIVTKGSLIVSERPREGWAVLAGSIELARAFDFPIAELRAIGNVQGALPDEDPAAGRALVRAGLDVARRLGIWGEVVRYASMVAAAHTELMEWDETLRLVRQFEREPLGPWAQIPLIWAESFVLAFRGDAAGVAALDAEREALRAHLSNPEYLAADRVQTAWTRIGLGRFEEALALANEARRPAAVVWWYPAATALLAALWLRDVAAAREALAEFDQVPGRGRHVDAERLKLEAGIAALAGDPDAPERFHRAVRAMRELELPFAAAMAQALMAVLLPSDHPDGAVAEREMRAAFGAVGATGFLAAVDRELAGQREAATRRSRDTRSEPAPRLSPPVSR